MRVSSVELRLVKLPLVSPFETSFGREAEKAALIVRMACDGIEAWGECVAGEGPWYSYETLATAWHVIEEYLAPLLLDRELEDPIDVNRLFARVRGHNMAKACLEMAAWDAFAKREGMPLSALLGGTRESIECGVSIGIQESVDRLVEVVGRFLEQRYRRIKVKIKPGYDVEVLRRLRREYPDILLSADANAAYAEEHFPLLMRLDEFNLLMLEQPLGADELVAHAELQGALKTPICLDESIHSLGAAKAALRLGSCRVINIKPGRVGGHLASKQLHDLCKAHGVPVWIGGMLETGIGRAHNIALASLDNFRLPGDLSASDRYFHEDIVEPPFRLKPDGTMDVPKGPGIGVEVKLDFVEKITLKKKLLR